MFDLIRTIVRNKTTQPNRSYFEECADFMLLLCRLAELIRDGDTVSPSNRRKLSYMMELVRRYYGMTVTEYKQSVQTEELV